MTDASAREIANERVWSDHRHHPQEGHRVLGWRLSTSLRAAPHLGQQGARYLKAASPEPRSSSPRLTRLMSCLILVVSVVVMSSLFFIGADRADPMPSKNERQGRSSNIFFFTTGYCSDTKELSPIPFRLDGTVAARMRGVRLFSP